MYHHFKSMKIAVATLVLLAGCSQPVTQSSVPLATIATAPPVAVSSPVGAPTTASQVMAAPPVIEPKIVRTIDGGSNQFDRPVDVALDSAGDLYVLDAGNDRVQEFNQQGNPRAMWGTPGKGEGQFNLVETTTGHAIGAIAVDGDNNVYVADALNYRIQKFDNSGNFLTQWGSKGTGDGQFLRPAGVDTDSQGNVYVYDVYTDVIQEFSPSGTFEARLGAKGGGNKSNDPSHIAVGTDGKIYESDSQLKQVEVYAAGGSPTSTWKFAWGPTGIALDSKGDVILTLPRSDEAGIFNHVWAFDPSGKPVFQFAATNDTMGVAVDKNDLIYLADEGKGLVEVVQIP